MISEDGLTQNYWIVYTNIVSKISTGENSDILVYPNPTGGIVNFQLDSQCDSAMISVYSLKGQLLLSFIPDDRIGYFSIEHLSEGIYLLNIQTSKIQTIFKLVKK